VSSVSTRVSKSLADVSPLKMKEERTYPES